jgi:hypothetical protein
MPTRLASFVVQLALVAVLLQACPLTLLAAKAASGRFSPHCDGAGFYLSKIDGLPSEQKINLNLRQHFSWWNYHPQGSLGRCICGTMRPYSHGRISHPVTFCCA